MLLVYLLGDCIIEMQHSFTRCVSAFGEMLGAFSICSSFSSGISGEFLGNAGHHMEPWKCPEKGEPRKCVISPIFFPWKTSRVNSGRSDRLKTHNLANHTASALITPCSEKNGLSVRQCGNQAEYGLARLRRERRRINGSPQYLGKRRTFFRTLGAIAPTPSHGSVDASEKSKPGKKHIEKVRLRLLRREIAKRKN